jgi:hypothetical protein
MNMAAGAPFPSTEPFGFRIRRSLDGPPTAMAIGSGFPRGDGRGWMMRPGGLPPSTMAAGLRFAASGDGCRLRHVPLLSP